MAWLRPAGCAGEEPDKLKLERTPLYYREGSSDTVYQAAIEPRGDLFVVNFACDRRGSTLSTGDAGTG